MDYAIVIWSVTALLTIAGWMGIRRFLERYAYDDEYEATTPGVSAREGRRAKARVRRQGVPVAPVFHPPAGVRPGELGTLIHRDAGDREYLATLVDLAMRGYLTMTPSDDGDHVFESTGKPRGDLLGFEYALLDGIFAIRPRVTQRQLQGSEYSKVRMSFCAALRERVATRGWFKRGGGTIFVVGGLGIIIAMVGAGIIEVGVIQLFRGEPVSWWPLGIPVMLAGLQMLFALGKCTARSAEGSAILAQAKGFERYLLTAEQDQLRFEEHQNLLSRYLAYAIVLGVVNQWTKELGTYSKAARRAQGAPTGTAYRSHVVSYHTVVGLPRWLNRILRMPEEPKKPGPSPDVRN